MKVALRHSLMKKLKKEAHGNEVACLLLAAESVTRRWLLSRRIPCWRCPYPPGTEARYSLLFADGRRAMVSVHPHHRLCFDELAKARCEYVIAVRHIDETVFLIDGFLGWKKILASTGPENEIDIRKSMLGGPESFTELLRDSNRFLPAFVSGSARLFLVGEWKTPPPPSCQPVRGCLQADDNE